jgi:hypothetical protein
MTGAFCGACGGGVRPSNEQGSGEPVSAPDSSLSFLNPAGVASGGGAAQSQRLSTFVGLTTSSDMDASGTRYSTRGVMITVGERKGEK